MALAAEVRLYCTDWQTAAQTPRGMLVEQAEAHTASPSTMDTEAALKEQSRQATTASPCPIFLHSKRTL